MRSFWIQLHRYAGLTIAMFLIVAGLTGSLLAFYEELDAAVNSRLHYVEPPVPGARPLSPFALRERVEALVPDAWVHYVPLHREPGQAAVFYAEGAADPATGEHAELDNDEFFLNPYTGEELGRRYWGDITQGATNLMPFAYRLHYSLAIPGSLGTWMFGIAALIWTLDCFVGFYLTLPGRQRNRSVRAQASPTRARRGSFWRRWKPAWRIKLTHSNGWRKNYDLHRAGGLWLWAMLLVFAWSSVGLNLGDQVYKPVMRMFFEFQEPYAGLQELPRDQPRPGIPWRQAHAIGKRLMAEQAEAEGFTVLREEGLGYDPHKGVYSYDVQTNHEIMEDYGQTELVFDANTGQLRYLELPSGQASGNTVTNWLYALHWGYVFGLPYRIFVSIMGLMVVILSVTGIVIWMKKRRATGKHLLPAHQRTRRERPVLKPDPAPDS